MMGSPIEAAGIGLAAGVFNGWLSRWALQRALRSTDAAFYAAFAGGMLYRLAFLIVTIWHLRHQRYIIILCYAICLVAAQFVFEVIPLQRNGPESHT